jgi:hypothetical protein
MNQIASVTHTHSKAKAEDLTTYHACSGMCRISSYNTHYLLPNLYRYAAVDECNLPEFLHSVTLTVLYLDVQLLTLYDVAF